MQHVSRKKLVRAYLNHHAMSKSGPIRPSSWSLATKLFVVGSAVLALALASIALTLWVTWKLEGGAAAVNDAGRVRMLVYRVALESLHCTRPDRMDDAARLDKIFHDLQEGDATRPLFVPWSTDTRARFAELRSRWATLHAAIERSRLPGGRTAEALQMPSLNEFVSLVDDFVFAIERHLAYWTKILRALQVTLVCLAVASAMAMLYAGHVLVLNPMSRLRQGLQRVSGGDFSARIPMATHDEFGQLADGFNQMTEHLQALYAQLEQRVRDKTAHLEAQRERLAALYSVSSFMARATTLDDLARGFASRVRVIGQAGAVIVRMLDDDGEHRESLATDDLPNADLTAQAVSAARVQYPAVIVVPVVLHQRVLGEIELRYHLPPVIGADERSLFAVLASHLAAAMESLRAEAMQKAEAVAAERGLIAQELHDSIAQSLAFMKIQIQLLREALRRTDAMAVEQIMGELDTGVRESYNDVRELLTHFRRRTNVQALEPALRATLKKFEHQTGLRVQLEVQDDAQGEAHPPLSPDVQVQVMHVVQEALTNVRKHAQARQVWLTLQYQPACRIDVIDDGCGFDAQQTIGDAHIGLRIMRERASRIGASLAVQPMRELGTRVTLMLPATHELQATS